MSKESKTLIPGFKEPLLAAKAPKALEKINYPALDSNKLDGVRFEIIDGKCLSRTFKPIPNDYARNWCEANLPDGFDGELCLRDLTTKFRIVSSAIMKKSGEPDFVACVFDWFTLNDLGQPFIDRYERLQQWFHERMEDHVMLVEQIEVADADEVRALHEEWTLFGFEGSMIRSIRGRYKCGRSTAKEGILLKLKNWDDAEAEIIGFEEQMKNCNVATVSATGHTKRSTHKANKVGKGTLGALRCRFADGTEFGLGTGLDDALKQEIWNSREETMGKFVKLKFQPDPGGRQPGQKPRIPVFLGFRDPSVD